MLYSALHKKLSVKVGRKLKKGWEVLR